MNRRETTLLAIIIALALVFSTAFKSQDKAKANPYNDELTIITQDLNELKDVKSSLTNDTLVLKQSSKELDTLVQEFKSEVDNTKKQLETAKEKKLISIKIENEKVAQANALKKANSINRVNVASAPISLEPNGDWSYFKASFYNAEAASTGKNPGDKQYGITRSGNPVTPGVTVSVDPNVIPLGTWIEIKYDDGTIEKRRADDTGGAIRGHKIDVFKPVSDSKLSELGVLKVQVRILKPSN